MFELAIEAVGRSRRLRNTALIAGALTWFVVPSSGKGAAEGTRERRLFLTFFAAGWSLHYTTAIAEVSQVACTHTYFNRALVRRARLYRAYWPVPWLVNRHAMTVGASIAGDLQALLRLPLQLTSETLPTFDGVNTVELDWCVRAFERSTWLWCPPSLRKLGGPPCGPVVSSKFT